MIVVVEPADTDDLPISLTDAKRHCRIDHTDDDLLLTATLQAAIEHVEGETSLILSPRTLQYRMDDWPCERGRMRRHCYIWGMEIDIPCAPVREVTSVVYVDTNGAEQTVDEASYEWERTPEGATITFVNGFSVPVIHRDSRGGLRVTFEAGYDLPEDAGDTPELIPPVRGRQAVLLIVGHWYENRETVSKDAMIEVPMAASSIIEKLRVIR